MCARVVHYRIRDYTAFCSAKTSVGDFTDEYQRDPQWHTKVTCTTCQQHPYISTHWDTIESKIAQQHQK